MSSEFTGWAIEALIASSILMAVVLLARKQAQQALGPQLAYWLWALPALRMALPPLPASWRESAAAPITAASETVFVLVEPILPLAAPDAAPFPWVAVVAGAWVLGALAFFAWHGLAHVSYVRRIVSPPARHAKLPDGTTLVESDEAVGPVAFGVLRRFVAVPSDFAERYDADERKLALAHELGHHARGDLIANWIALAMLAVHWFNPLAWVAYRKFRADQEMANDARVLSSLPPIERHAYACAIVKAAHGRAVTAACHLHTIEDLKGRLRMLKMSRKSRRVVVAGAVGIASLTVVGLGLTASGAAAEKIRTVAETQVVSMAQTVAPTPPVALTPPAPPAPGAERKKVVINRNGKTEIYEGAEADAYLAANPEIGQHAGGRNVRRHRIVINENGKRRVYEGADADAYLKAHPNMRPPLPPLPPIPGGAALAPLPPLPGAKAMVAPPASPSWTVRAGPGAPVMRRFDTGPGGYAYVTGDNVEVDSGDCDAKKVAGFVRTENKGGKHRVIICEKQIERMASAHARTAAQQAQLASRTQRMAIDHARYGQSSALYGLNAGRAAILSARGLTDDQREQALAGIDRAREEIERELRETKRDH